MHPPRVRARMLGGRVRSKIRRSAHSPSITARRTSRASRTTLPSRRCSAPPNRPARSSRGPTPTAPTDLWAPRAPSSTSPRDITSSIQNPSSPSRVQAPVVGAPSMASLPSFVADRLARAESPEASWVGDNATRRSRVPLQRLRRSHRSSRPRRHGVVGRQAAFSERATKEMMLRCREGGHMWYKPWECDALVLATNAPAAAKRSSTRLPPRRRTMAASRAPPSIAFPSPAAARLRPTLLVAQSSRSTGNLRLPHRGVALRPPHDSGIVWFANNSSKPGRPSEGRGAASAGWGYRWAEVGRAPQTGEGGVGVQASGAWTAARSNRPPDDVARELCRLFLRVVGRDDGAILRPCTAKPRSGTSRSAQPRERRRRGASSKDRP